MNLIMYLILDPMFLIGLLLLIPTFFMLVHGVIKFLFFTFTSRNKNIIISHYHNGKLVKKTTLKPDPKEPIEFETF